MENNIESVTITLERYTRMQSEVRRSERMKEHWKKVAQKKDAELTVERDMNVALCARLSTLRDRVNYYMDLYKQAIEIK